MKYLKKFEENKEKVRYYVNNEIDDLRLNGVQQNDPNLIRDNNKLPIDAKFKIGDYVRIKTSPSPKFIYKLTYYYKTTNKEFACFITIDTFSRTWELEKNLEKLTDKEVEEYEMKLATKKYNL